MLQLLIDENFDQRILRGVRLQIPSLDYLVVQETALKGSEDPSLLSWAATHSRILETHDVNTVPRHAYDRVRDGERMAGVIIVPDDMAIGAAIEELATLVECSSAKDFVDQVKYLPI